MPASTRVRRSWRIGGSLLTVGVLGFGTLQAVVGLAHRTETVLTRITEPVRIVDVDSADGSVRIVAAPARTVGAMVTADLDHGLRDTENTVRLEGDRLVVQSSCPILLSSFCSADYTIEVPPDTDVRVRSRDAGVAITRVTGSIEAKTGDGSLRIEDASGVLDLSSTDGDIEATGIRSATVTAQSRDGSVRVVFRAAPRTVDASSVDGSIDVVVPDESGPYEVDAAAHDGSVDTPVRTAPDADRSIRARSTDGNITIRYPRG